MSRTPAHFAARTKRVACLAVPFWSAVAGCDRRETPAAPPPAKPSAAARDAGGTPAAGTATAPVVLTPVPTTRPRPPADFTFAAAKDLAAEYEKDREAAAAKYGKRVIEVTGTVYSVLQTRSGEGYVVLDGAIGSAGLTCYTAHPRPWAVVAQTQRVRLRGVGNADAWGFPLLDGEFVALGPSASVSVTAAGIAGQLDRDAAAFDAAYGVLSDRSVLVTGVVVANGRAGDDAKLELRGSGGVSVEAYFVLPLHQESVAPIKPGQTVTVYSPSVRSERDLVQLKYCMLVSP